MNILLRDYAAWKMSNHNFYNMLEKNIPIVFDRVYPIYEVLGNLYDEFVEDNDIEEDLQVIFSYGFNYLVTQFEFIKIVYDNYLNRDPILLNSYQTVINYLMYLNDLKADIMAKELNYSVEEIDPFEEEMENILVDNKKIPKDLGIRFEDTLKNWLLYNDYEFISITDIFVEIAEEIGLYLYENDDFVLGKDI